MKTYVTFGQDHTHEVNGKTFNHNTVAVINCNNAKDGRAKAFEFFGPKFCFEYHEERFNQTDMSYYPGGQVEVNP